MPATATALRPNTLKVGRGVIVLLSLAVLAGGIFLVVFALPYFLLNPEKLALYKAREGWVLLHISTGAVALALGPFVIWLGLNRRRMAVHRALGMGYMGSIALSSIAAYYLALHTDISVVFGMGLSGLATAWIVTTGLAFLSIRKRLIEQHKEWMTRSYVVTFGFVFFRIFVGVLQVAGVGTLTEQLNAASWFCWAAPLLVTEAVLQGKKILRSNRTQRLSME